MRTLSLFVIASCTCLLTFGQEIEKKLKPFKRVVASPRVHVILTQGEREAVRLIYHNVNADNINIEVNRRTLKIFLDGARKIEPMKQAEDAYGRRESMYKDASVTAYVTYRTLELLEIRGNQELTCKGKIVSEHFTLRAYGENEISLASLKTEFFKAKLYGENTLRIRDGRALEQKYSLYGENKIDNRALESDYITTSIFGEGSLKINSSEEVRINAIGEPKIVVDGGAQIYRGLVIGKAYIRQD